MEDFWVSSLDLTSRSIRVTSPELRRRCIFVWVAPVDYDYQLQENFGEHICVLVFTKQYESITFYVSTYSEPCFYSTLAKGSQGINYQINPNYRRPWAILGTYTG